MSQHITPRLFGAGTHSSSTGPSGSGGNLLLDACQDFDSPSSSSSSALLLPSSMTTPEHYSHLVLQGFDQISGSSSCPHADSASPSFVVTHDDGVHPVVTRPPTAGENILLGALEHRIQIIEDDEELERPGEEKRCGGLRRCLGKLACFFCGEVVYSWTCYSIVDCCYRKGWTLGALLLKACCPKTKRN